MGDVEEEGKQGSAATTTEGVGVVGGRVNRVVGEPSPCPFADSSLQPASDPRDSVHSVQGFRRRRAGDDTLTPQGHLNRTFQQKVDTTGGVYPEVGRIHPTTEVAERADGEGGRRSREGKRGNKRKRETKRRKLG